jgi:hypothetical protein
VCYSQSSSNEFHADSTLELEPNCSTLANNRRRLLLLNSGGAQEPRGAVCSDQSISGGAEKIQTSAALAETTLSFTFENNDFNQLAQRRTLTHTLLSELLLWLDTCDQQWYLQRDFTGRLKQLDRVGKLSAAFTLVNLV